MMTTSRSKRTEIVLFGLKKISLNQWYAGIHWSQRKAIKDKFAFVIRSQFKARFSKKKRYEVHYDFGFKKNPLDAMNCVAMAKMIEDVIFEDDKWDIIESVTIKSRKCSSESVKITIFEKQTVTQGELF